MEHSIAVVDPGHDIFNMAWIVNYYWVHISIQGAHDVPHVGAENWKGPSADYGETEWWYVRWITAEGRLDTIGIAHS